LVSYGLSLCGYPALLQFFGHTGILTKVDERPALATLAHHWYFGGPNKILTQVAG
jgi:hypothetical protein